MTVPRLSISTAAAVAACIALAVVASCYNPDLTGDGYFRCDDGKCPGGFVCNPSNLHCEREGETTDGSVGADATAALGKCELTSEPTEISAGALVVGSVGVALDDSSADPAVLATFPGAPTTNLTGPRQLYLARGSISATTQGITWNRKVIIEELPSSTTTGKVPYFSVVASTSETVAAVVGTPNAEDPNRVLQLYLERTGGGPSATTLRLSEATTMKPFNGAYPALQFLGPRRVLFAGQSISAEDTTQKPVARVAMLDVDSSADPVAQDIQLDGVGSSIVSTYGVFNRLNASTTTGAGTASLAFVAVGSDPGQAGGLSLPTMEVYVATAAISTSRDVGAWGAAQPVDGSAGRALSDSEEELIGLGAAWNTNGYELVFPYKSLLVADDPAALVYAVEGATTTSEIRPGDGDTVAGARPSLALRDGHSVVMYMASGRAWLTARSSADRPWSPALAADDTTTTTPVAGQVAVVASDSTDNSITLQLFYVRQRDSSSAINIGLYHRSAVCTF